MRATITNFIVNDTADGYFTAHLDNGGVRIGLVDCECFDFPSDHEDYARIVALSADELESAHDELMVKYACTNCVVLV